MTETSLDQLLLEACKSRQSDKVADLLAKGANPNVATDDDQKSALMYAAERNDIQSMRLLLQAGAAPDAQTTNYNETAFICAASVNAVEAMQLLFEHGADFEGKIRTLLIGLERTIKPNHWEAFQWLLDHDINFFQNSAYGRHPLLFAIEENRLEMLQAMLKKQAPEKSDETLIANMFFESLRTGNPRIFDFLYERFPEHFDVKSFAVFYLRSAASGGNLALFKRMIDLGCNPRVYLQSHTNSLVSVAASGRYSLEMIKYLIEELNFPIVQNGDLENSLCYACMNANLELAEYLISRGAGVNIQNENGNTPLMLAVEESESEIVDLLLKHQANPNLSDEYGNTALHKAINPHYGPRPEIINALISSGAEVNLQCHDGNTALMYATDPEIIGLLLAAGADRSLKNHEGKTAMDWALEYEDEELIEALK